MRRAILFAAAVAGLWAARSPARDDGYTITLREGQPGDKTKVTKAGTEAVKYAFVVMGRNQTRDDKKGTKFVYAEEVVERPAGARRPTKLVRTYETAERTTDGKTEKLPYDGKKVTIELKGKKYAFTVDGEDIPPADAEDLEREFNRESEGATRHQDFMPKKPVALNEVWAVDTDIVVKSFEAQAPFRLDKDTTKVTGKLTKVYDKGGTRFGTIELVMTLPVTALKQPGKDLGLKPGSTITAKLDLDVCIDGTKEDGTAVSTMAVDIRADLPNGTLTISGGNAAKTIVRQTDAK